MVSQCCHIGNSPIQALSVQRAQLYLRHVEPTAVLGCVMDFQAFSQATSLLRFKRLVKRGKTVCVQIVLEVEPLTGKRHVEAAEHRTRKDWALWIKGMLVKRYPKAVKVRLVLDNLNTHCLASLYETFKPQEARRLAERLEIHYTPKHGSWLNMAEIELSALNGQSLDRRIPDMAALRSHIAAWENDRNNRQAKIQWQFTNAKARIKLKRLYPQL